MSMRDKLFTMLDSLSDEQLEGLYDFLCNFITISEEPSDEMRNAMNEAEDMRANPDKYKSYSSFAELLAEVKNEV